MKADPRWLTGTIFEDARGAMWTVEERYSDGRAGGTRFILRGELTVTWDADSESV